MKTLTNEDYRIVQQPVLDIRLRFEIYDKNKEYINSIDGNVINGSGTIDAESDIRRSFSITIYPDYRSKLIIDEQGYIWIDKYVHIYIGIIDMQTGESYEWKFGEFLFTNVNTTYDPVTNQMSINCSDLMSLLDGSKNGELGQLQIIYPAYEEDENGTPTHYNTIRNAVIDTISQLGRINEFEIDEIGEYNAMSLYNPNYIQYRIESMVELPDGSMQEMWDTIPYDQEFSSGTTVLTILNTFRDLYPNYESYFNENGVFCMNMIPSGDEDPVMIDDDFFQKIYISENTSIDLTTVRNVSHVWGQVLETDFYADTSTYADNIYSIEIEGYTDDENKNYKNGDRIAFRVTDAGSINGYFTDRVNLFGNVFTAYFKDYPEQIDLDKQVSFVAPDYNSTEETYLVINNFNPIPIYKNGTTEFINVHTIGKGNTVVVSLAIKNGILVGNYLDTNTAASEIYVKVNDLKPIPIYDENTEQPLKREQLEVDNIYVFKIKSKYINAKNIFRAYWLGSWQAQGICALVGNAKGGDLLYVGSTLKIDDDVTEGFFNVEDGEFYATRTWNEDDNKYIYSDKYEKVLNMVYYQRDIDVYYRVVRRYSEQYFRDVYACPSVRLKVIPDSPFTCQKIGEYMDVMTDDKNITSSSLAVSRADWEVYKQARLTDSISLTTTLCPFADVNIKVAYRRHDLNKENPYIVKNISHDFSGGTTTWQLMRFYPLYERNHMTHGQIKEADYTHGELSLYQYEDI